MQLKSVLSLVTAAMLGGPALTAQQPASPEHAVTLDSCRTMAMTNNKEMRIQAERIKGAGYQKKEALAAYLPNIDFAGGYTYNQKEISIFDKDQYLPTMTFNPQTQKYDYNLVTNPATGAPVKGPDGNYIPSTVALIPKEAMTYDIHNVFFGAVTLTQPIFMGGKIVAMNKIAGFAEEIARSMHASQADNVIYAVDAAYWQVVSLKAKQKLAVSYVNLLDSLQHNVKLMVDQGVATKSDLLSVDVKLNQAHIDLTKVDNGLVLSRMLLAQLCGLPVDARMTLADEDSPVSGISRPIATTYDMQQVYDRRSDLKALALAGKVTEQKAKVAMSAMLPNVALVGSYSFSNPNMFDGFKKRFDGAFSVGAMVTIPIWHWGGNYNKYRAARTQARIMELQLEDAKEKVNLQVSQAAFKAQEAIKTYDMTSINMSKADENLHTAQVAFREGVATVDNVMAAQTAWLMANSERIDASIDVRLCEVYLAKVLGNLSYRTE